jgi:hypothetical protein
MRRALALLITVGVFVAGCGDAPPAPPIPPTPAPLEPTATPADDPPGGERRPGWITGQATDSRGTPLADVHVIIRSGSVTMGSAAYYEVQPDATGHYAQEVPGTSYAITAYAMVRYQNRTYKRWLHPVDGIESPIQDVRGGLVKDFVLKLAGLRPSGKDAPDNPGSYYGGEIDLGDDAEYRFFYNQGAPEPPPYPAGTKVRLDLTPDGPLLDDSPGTVLSYDLDATTLATAVLRDVPLGDYTARATLLEAGGGTSPLRVATKVADGTIGSPQPGDTAAVRFMPESLGSYGVTLVPLYILRP